MKFRALLTLLLATAGLATAAPDIAVEGDDGAAPGWPNIDDGDLVADQQVTDFDNVQLGSSSVRTYRVRNTGNSALTVSSAASGNAQFTISGLPDGTNVAANAENEFTIRFTPSSRGLKTATITIRSNDPDAEDPYTFNVEGTGEGPEILMSGSDDGTDPYDAITDGDTTPAVSEGTNFGTIAAGSTRDRFFRIKNNGDSALHYENPVITGPNAGAFEVRSLSTIDHAISAGNSREFEIRFSPTTAGVKTATFSMGNDDPEKDPYTFALTGSATGQPDIQIQGQDTGIWNNIADGDHTPDQAVTDFGNVDLGDTRARNFRVRNEGNDTLNISARSSSAGAFTFSSLPAGTTVAPGAEHEFTLSFNPVTQGTQTARLTINSDDPDAEATYTFDVTGFGRGPEIAFSGSNAEAGPYSAIIDGDATPRTADGTDFGTVAVGNNRDRFFRVSNSGTDGLNMQAPVFTGSGAAHFSVRSLDTTTNMGQGNSRDFVIRFEPASGGTKTAIFTMFSNDFDEGMYTFTVTGVATVEPDIRVRGTNVTQSEIADGDLVPDQEVTDFGRVKLGLAGVKEYRIVNDGTAALNVSSATSSNAQFSIFLADNGVVPPGQSIQLLVSAIPSTRGVINSTITINSNDPDSENPYTFAITCIGEGPEINIQGRGADNILRNIPDGTTTTASNTGTDFGSVNVTGGTAQRSYRLFNNGDKSLTVAGRSFSGAAASDYDVSDLLIAGVRIINAGNFIDFTVTFNPSTSGARNATLSINSDDADEDPYTFALTGNGAGTPEIRIQGNRELEPRVEIADGDNTPRQSGGTLFADTNAGSDRTHNYRIHNDGDGRLTLSTPTLTGSNPTAFQILNFTSGPLEPGETRDFNIRFAPNNSGVKSAVFSMANNDSSENPYNFTIQGTSIAPEIAIAGGSSFSEEIADGDTTPREADGTDFGFVGLSGQSASRSFHIQNSGNSNLSSIVATTSNAQFTVSTPPAATVQPGGLATFTVTFDPNAAGVRTATVTVASNDPNESPYTFAVTGYGTDANALIRVTGDNNTAFTSGQTATSAANGTNMGQVNITSGTAVRVFHVENTGTGVLTLTGVTSNNSFFTVGALNLAPVNPGETADFSVTFDPLNAGIFTGTISIASNAVGSATFTFRVTGEGVTTAPPSAPELDLFGGDNLDVSIVNGDTTPRGRDGTDFQQAEAGTPVSKTFRIRNTGNAVLNIASSSATGVGSVSGLAASIPAGGSDDFTVTINRANPGIASVTVTINSNDANENPFTFAVTLEALASTGVLDITDVQSTGADLTLTFTSISGRTFRVASSADLTAGPWSPLAGFTGITGDSLPQSIVLPNALAASPRQFYRIEQE